MDKKSEEFYKGLKEQLESSTTWPSEYLYKFIVPATSDKNNDLVKIFDNIGAVITTKKSSTGKYISYSINVRMNSPKNVIEKYIEVSNIKGLISL
jgi:putative lipoic acid-binding regulatory protein